MAYIVSQLRKNGTPGSTGTYMEDIPILSSTYSSPNTFGGTDSFTDLALYLDPNYDGGKFISSKVYYLRFRVQKIPQYYYQTDQTYMGGYSNDTDTLSVRLLLTDTEKENEEGFTPQEIGSFVVPHSVSTVNEYSSFSFVFSPTKSFNRLVFRVNRVTYDAIYHDYHRQWLTDTTPTSTVIRHMDGGSTVSVSVQGTKIEYDGTNGDFCVLKNIVPSNQKWVKFGYQSRPGNLIVVNGQPIIVGRSGIYEIDNGTKIESFMIANPNGSDNSNIDSFLLDYAYLG